MVQFRVAPGFDKSHTVLCPNYGAEKIQGGHVSTRRAEIGGHPPGSIPSAAAKKPNLPQVLPQICCKSMRAADLLHGQRVHVMWSTCELKFRPFARTVRSSFGAADISQLRMRACVNRIRLACG